MANVFTKKNRLPKTTTLSDFYGQDPLKSKTLPRILSPTRIENPHPRGLTFQFIKAHSMFGIWNPDFNRIQRRMPEMLRHLRWVNFSCGPVTITPKEMGKVPDVKYTENTISRKSYDDPKRYPHLHENPKISRFAYKPQPKPTRGIVPTVFPPAYQKVLDIPPNNSALS